jgi:2'-5' RNA ligase
MMLSAYCYGFYLRPDFATSRAHSEMHRVLRAQYNLIAAGLFMPHATLKGFFRSDAPPETMITRLDRSMAGWRSFTAYNNGVCCFGPRSIVTSIRDHPDGTRNLAIDELQERAWSALEPLIHPTCEFSGSDPRGIDGPHPFHPHLTLVMSDLRPELQREVITFIAEDGLVGPSHFTVNTCHLYRFHADWSRPWWHTLTWELLQSWQATDTEA